MENAINIAYKRNVPLKVPILKITINKKYNKRLAPYPEFWDQTHTTENVNFNDNLKGSDLQGNTSLNSADIKTDSNPQNSVAHNPISDRIEKHIKWKYANAKEKDDIDASKRTWKRKGDLSRESVRNQTNAERLRHLNTKAQRELEILTIRLKALKERYKFEKKEIVKLNKYLSLHCKDIPIEPTNEITKERSKIDSNCTNFIESENEDEYEKMLREVRKMKQMLEESPVMKILYDRYEEARLLGGCSQENNVKYVHNSGNRETIHSICHNSHTFNDNIYTNMILTTGNNEHTIEIKEECIDCIDN